MKRFLLKIILFFSLFLVLDFLFGLCCEKMKVSAKGKSGDDYHIAECCYEDVLIFGSSRAYRHYAPQILEDSLGFSVYNCGSSGSGIIYQFGRFQMVLEHHRPKVVVYDIYPIKDLLPDDKLQYLSGLRHYKDHKAAKNVAIEVDWRERYKLFSNMYCFNTDFLYLLKDCVSPSEKSYKGFIPHKSSMNYDPVPGEDSRELVLDSLKIDYIQRLIKLTKDKGVLLVFCASPHYFAPCKSALNSLDSICKKNDVPFLNFYDYKAIASQKQFYFDPTHLNEDGATEYTKMFADSLRNLCKEKGVR